MNNPLDLNLIDRLPGPLVLDAADLASLPPRTIKRRYGNWRVLKGRLRHARYGYEVSTADMTTSAACLDWIMQVAAKSCFTPEDKADLLDAIRDIVDPQAGLCSFGIERGRTRG